MATVRKTNPALNENHHLSAAESYSEALNSGHARMLTPGKNYIIYTSDNAFELGDWPVRGFEEADGADGYILPSGGSVPKSEYDRLNAIMDSTEFDGNNHGFHYGISMRTPDELDRADFEYLRSLRAAAEIDVPPGAILVDTVALDSSDDGIYESYYVMLTPDGKIENLY